MSLRRNNLSHDTGPSCEEELGVKRKSWEEKLEGVRRSKEEKLGGEVRRRS